MSEHVEVPEVIRTYLDKLTDEQRDRVISAEAFKIGGGYEAGHPGGPRTITRTKVKQQAMDMNFSPGAILKKVEETYEVIEPARPTTGCLIDHATAGTSTDGYMTVGNAFDRFFQKHRDRAIHAIKTYAARMNRIELPAHVETEEWAQVPAEVGA